jgi:HSP20 family protein
MLGAAPKEDCDGYGNQTKRRWTVAIPIQIDPDRIRAEYRDGVIALFILRAEREKPRSIKITWTVGEQSWQPIKSCRCSRSAKSKVRKRARCRGGCFSRRRTSFETSEALTLVLEMPGVDKGSVEVKVENDVLNIEGRVDFSKYDGLKPLYTEYNVGHYARSFRLSSKIEQEGISAELKDGVMTLILPKAEKARTRKIQVSWPPSG